MRIGITIGLRSPDEDLWVNGIKLNALYLAELLVQCPSASHVMLVNTTPVDCTPFRAHLPDSVPVVPIAEAVGQVDLLLVLGGAISQSQQDQFQQHHAKVIWYRCGSECISSIEAVIFGREIGGAAAYPQGADGVWLIPQVAEHNGAFYETLFRLQPKVVPFVWSETWLERAWSQVGQDTRTARPPSTKGLRISVFEPNIDVIKFCYFPLFAIEQAYRLDPSTVALVSVTNTSHIRTSAEFVNVVGHLDIVRNRICFFEDRFQLPWFLANHTDIVVSHQWLNPLNYLYLDAAWLGFPVVHNGDLCKDVGFYYPGSSLPDAVQALRKAQEINDDTRPAFAVDQRRHVMAFSRHNPEIVMAYDKLLSQI